jgi:predicted transcriptional regulator
MRMKKVSLSIPPTHIAQVDELAEKRKRSRSFIVAEAIEKYLANGHAKPTPPMPKKKAGTR